MKKWLVGLMAAGLCVASAWAETVTYTVAGKAVSVTAGAEPDGASAVYEQTYSTSGQATAGNSMTLTLKGYDGATITGLTLSMHSNTQKGGGALSVTCGSDTIASIADKKFNDGWYNEWSKDFVDVTPAVTATTVGGDVVIKIEATENSLFIESYTIEYAMGDPEFSVTFDKENWFKVRQGQASSVTAIPKYGVEPYTFLWSCDKFDIQDATKATLEIPDTLAEGDYTLSCMVTEDNGEGDVINKQIGFTVEAAPVITGDAYTRVTSADNLKDGMLVVLTGPDGAYALPAEIASGVFAVSAVADFIVDDVLTTEDSSIIWKLVADGKGNFSLYNEKAEQYAGHDGKDGNSGRLQEDAFPNTIAIADAEAGLFTVTSIAPDAKDAYRSLQYNYNNGNARFAYYKGTQKNLRIYAAEAGPAKFSISLDPAKYFEVEVGKEASITATPKNAEGDVHYAWTIGGKPAGSDSAVLGLDTSAATEELEVVCTATDGADTVATAKVSYKVVVPATKYPVTIAEGIENGEIAVDKTEAEEGEIVTVTATPAAGYALEKIFVNGVAISATTFPMPAEAVEVGATFAEVKDYAELPFIAEDTPYSGPWKGATVDGLTSKGLSDDYKDGSAKLDSANDWIQVKFAGTPGSLSFGIKGNSLSDEKPSTFVVQESADGEEWSVLETYATGGKLTGERTDETLALSASSQFVRFFYQEKGAGNVGIYDVYISSGGPAKFSISLDPAKYFEVEVDAEAAITATPKNADGDVKYEWSIGGTPVDATGAVLTLDTSKPTEELEVVCTATDGAGAEATAKVSYKVVAPAQKYPVTVASGIENGTVTVDVEEAAEGDTVTVTATPAAGYKLDKITVNGEAIGGNTFKMGAAPAEVSATFVESVGVTYTRIESMDDFEADAEYLVVAYKKDAFSSALKNELTGKRIALEEVEIVDNTVTTDDDSIVWTISAGAEGKYTLYNAAKGVYAAAPSGATANEAQLVSDGTADLAQWSISVAEEDPLVTIGSAHEGRSLQRNSTATYAYFANYANGAKPYLFKKGGTAKLSVGFDKSNGFTIPLGEASSITATAKNGQEPYTYVWDGDLEGEGATLAIPATLAAKDYTVQVTVTDGAGDKVSKQIGFTVQAPVEKYAITVERVPGGVLAVDKDEAEAGETVTVTATPDPGMKLESITVNGTPISGKTFPMPAEAVTVSGTFVQVTGRPFTLISSVDDLEDGAEYVITDNTQAYAMKAELSTSSTKRLVNEAVAPVDGVITTDDASIIWKLVKDADGNFALYSGSQEKYVGWSSGNSAKFQDDAFANTISYEDEAKLFVVMATSTAELEKPRKLQFNSAANALQFAYYEGGQKNLCFFKASGAPAFSVTLEPAAYFEVEAGKTATITATPKNAAEGAVTYAWTVGGSSVSATGATLTLDTSKATEVLEVVCTATDAAGATATAKVSYKVVAAPTQPVVECEDAPTGAVEAGKPLTLTFKASHFEVDPDGWYFEVDGEAVDPSAVTYSDDYQTATVTLTPEKSFKLAVSAYEVGFPSEDPAAVFELSVTVGGEPGPGEEPYIKSIKVDAKAKTVTLTLADPTGKVRTTANLATGEWTLNDKAATDGMLELPMDGSPMFYGAP